MKHRKYKHLVIQIHGPRVDEVIANFEATRADVLRICSGLDEGTKHDLARVSVVVVNYLPHIADACKRQIRLNWEYYSQSWFRKYQDEVNRHELAHIPTWGRERNDHGPIFKKFAKFIGWRKSGLKRPLIHNHQCLKCKLMCTIPPEVQGPSIHVACGGTFKFVDPKIIIEIMRCRQYLEYMDLGNGINLHSFINGDTTPVEPEEKVVSA